MEGIEMKRESAKHPVPDDGEEKVPKRSLIDNLLDKAGIDIEDEAAVNTTLIHAALRAAQIEQIRDVVGFRIAVMKRIRRERLVDIVAELAEDETAEPSSRRRSCELLAKCMGMRDVLATQQAIQIRQDANVVEAGKAMISLQELGERATKYVEVSPVPTSQPIAPKDESAS